MGWAEKQGTFCSRLALLEWNNRASRDEMSKRSSLLTQVPIASSGTSSDFCWTEQVPAQIWSSLTANLLFNYNTYWRSLKSHLALHFWDVLAEYIF